jgi:hypothetical protein
MFGHYTPSLLGDLSPGRLPPPPALAARFRESLSAQLVDATPILSSGLIMGCSGMVFRGCRSFFPKQDAFSLHLCSRTFLAFGIPGLGSSSKCCDDPLRPPRFSGLGSAAI